MQDVARGLLVFWWEGGVIGGLGRLGIIRVLGKLGVWGVGMACKKYNVKVEKFGGCRIILVVERGVAYSFCTSFIIMHKKSGVAF